MVELGAGVYGNALYEIKDQTLLTVKHCRIARPSIRLTSSTSSFSGSASSCLPPISFLTLNSLFFTKYRVNTIIDDGRFHWLEPIGQHEAYSLAEEAPSEQSLTLAGVNTIVNSESFRGRVENGRLFGKVDVGIQGSVVLDVLLRWRAVPGAMHTNTRGQRL